MAHHKRHRRMRTPSATEKLAAEMTAATMAMLDEESAPITDANKDMVELAKAPPPPKMKTRQYRLYMREIGTEEFKDTDITQREMPSPMRQIKGGQAYVWIMEVA